MGTPSTLGISDPLTPFAELLVNERTPIIELKSAYNIVSALRNVKTETGGATVTATSGEHVLTTTALASDVARLESAERGRYIPGYAAEAGIGVRSPITPAYTGAMVARWGYFDANDGFGFGRDATGIFVFLRRGGEDTITYQSAWNADRLQGAGASGLTLAPGRGQIYQVRYTWYGYGAIEWRVVLCDSLFRQQTVVVHRTAPNGQTSIQNPDLPLRAEVLNGATAAAHILYVGGRQYSILGRYVPNRRITAGRRLALGSIGTTFLPLVTLRRKSSGTYGSVSAKVEGFDILTDADLIVQLRLNAALTGASYGTPDDVTAQETALERDASATAVTNGELLWEGLVFGGSGGNARGAGSVGLLDFDFIGQQPVTLCVRRVSSTNATASAVLRVKEEW